MAQDAPYFPRAATEDQDLGGINQNFRDLSDRGKDLVGGSDVPGNKCFGTDALCYNDAESRAEVGPNGVCFADGTCQTTAAGGGGEILGSTTFYGYTDLRGYTPGVFVPFSTASVSAATSCSFSGLSSTVTWRMEWELAQNTSNGYWQVRINGDSGTKYRYAVFGNVDNGNNSNAYSTGNTRWDIGASVTGDPVWAAAGGTGWIEFATIPGSNRVVMKCGYTYLSSVVFTVTSTACGGWYDGTTAISSVELLTSAGTFTGDILLSRKVKR